MEVISEQWILTLQLLHEDLWEVLMRLVSTPTIYHARGAKRMKGRSIREGGRNK